jgi:putative endonuclease
MEEAFVYLLRCADGSLYCGWTVDPARRIAAHRAGKGSAYVARRLPIRYAALWRAPSRSHAMSAEARIKRLPRQVKLALVRGAALPPELGPLEPLSTR